jgi:hypothetical protein
VISPRLIDAQSNFYKTRLERWDALPESLRLRLKAMVVICSRLAEDCLAEAFHEGARQFVLLGAGHDTITYRRPDWANSLGSLTSIIQRLSNGSAGCWLMQKCVWRIMGLSFPSILGGSRARVVTLRF